MMFSPGSPFWLSEFVPSFYQKIFSSHSLSAISFSSHSLSASETVRCAVAGPSRRVCWSIGRRNCASVPSRWPSHASVRMPRGLQAALMCPVAEFMGAGSENAGAFLARRRGVKMSGRGETFNAATVG
jgi:hypothetical protein